MTCLHEARIVFCSNCGGKVDIQDRFCSFCGKALNIEQEQENELLSFGPWGISICFGRPGFFVLTQQNNTKIILTNKRIFGLASHSGRLRFEAHFNQITSMENTNYALFKVLYFQYREGEKTKELSIMGNPVNYNNISRAYELMPK